MSHVLIVICITPSWTPSVFDRGIEPLSLPTPVVIRFPPPPLWGLLTAGSDSVLPIAPTELILVSPRSHQIRTQLWESQAGSHTGPGFFGQASNYQK